MILLYYIIAFYMDIIHNSKRLCLAISHYLSLSHYLTITKNCNHKRLGIYYLLSAFIFGISGTLISVLIRIELLLKVAGERELSLRVSFLKSILG